MSTRKHNAILRLSKTAQYPATFRARLALMSTPTLSRMTAAQIAEVIDGPLHTTFGAGYWSGREEAL